MAASKPASSAARTARSNAEGGSCSWDAWKPIAAIVSGTTRAGVAPISQRVELTDMPWWRDAVVYQIYPRSFADADGDGVGDLAGICTRLDHVAGLGVEAVWLSPIYRSPMADFGYDVSDHCAVDPLFGDLDAFDRLVDECHSRG